MEAQQLFELTLDAKVLADYRLAAPDSYRRVEPVHLNGDLVIIVWPASTGRDARRDAMITGELLAIVSWLVKVTDPAMAMEIIARAQRDGLIREL